MRQTKEIKIDVTQFPMKNDTKNEYGLNGINRQLYEFFYVQKNARNTLYRITYPDYLTLRKYTYDNLEGLYARYGIYFEEGLREETTAIMEVVPEDVFCSDATSLKVFLDSKCASAEGELLPVVFVAEVSEDKQRVFFDTMSSENKELYKDIIDRYEFLNIYSDFAYRRNILEHLQKDPWYKTKKLRNMLDILLEKDCLVERTNYNAYIACYKTFLDECLRIGEQEPNTCFYFDETTFDYSTCKLINVKARFEDFYNRLYPFIAAYLKLHNVTCYVEDRGQWECSHGIIDSYSKDNLFLCDYLKSLRTPIPIGILNSGKGGFASMVTRKNSVPISLTYRIKAIKVIECNVDGVTRLQVADDDIRNLHCDDRDIEVLDFREYYDLHTRDFEKGKSESSLLFSLLNNIHTLLGVKDVSLDVSNAILFKMSGSLHIGQLEKLNYKVTYKTKSLLRGYKYEGEIEMDEAKYTSAVLDIRAFDDYPLILGGGTASKEITQKLSRKLPNTVNGILVALLCHTAANITEDCGLYYDEVGLFGIPTKACRGTSVNQLVKCGLPLRGLQNTFLTYFGGPHMYLGKNVDSARTTLRIDQNLWRQ